MATGDDHQLHALRRRNTNHEGSRTAVSRTTRAELTDGGRVRRNVRRTSLPKQQHAASVGLATAPNHWWAGSGRQIVLLATAQALFLCSLSVDLTMTSLVGDSLAPTPALATLPFAFITLGSVGTTIPASLVMARYGRRFGFLCGAGVATVGGVLSVVAVTQHNFALFCVGTLCMGIYQGCTGYYRYAAADQVAVADRGRAISTVLTGGVIAAVAGPFMATGMMNAPIFGSATKQYVGSYALVAVLALLAMCVVAMFQDRSDHTESVTRQTSRRGESLSAIVRQPGFAVGAFGAMVGYFSMMVLMTVGPIAARSYGHDADHRAFMIQLHMVGMYAPALVAGLVIRRIGAGWLQFVGAVCGIVGVLIGASGTEQFHFVVSLALIGIAWSLTYASGSTLIASSYRDESGSRTQAFGELLIMAGSTLGGISAAALLRVLGWTALNLTMTAVLLPVALATLAHLAAKTRSPGHAGESRS
ncbi:MFS transporter [Nocardia sp. NPDC051321]|uniref:MFS transporter n=1 Tax=Nocardia sp. NPDC051321 TaxID=3364323 RepID=UPI0037AD4E4F